MTNTKRSIIIASPFPYIKGIFAALGIQVFLYPILRLRQTQIKGTGKSLAACCSHYLVMVLPVLGVPFVSTAIASLERYQTVFFFIGVLSNIF